MTETETPTRMFTAEAEGVEISTYRPLNKLALATSIAAGASFSALFHSLLWVVPAIAVVLAIAALVSLRRMEDKQSGHGLALAGLAIATFVGFYAPVRGLSQENVRYRQAQTFAEQWLELIKSGRLYEAHQLRLSPFQRYQGPKTLDEHYTQLKKNSDEMRNAPQKDDMQQMMEMSSDPYFQYQSFLLDPVVTKLLAIKEHAQIRCTGDIGQVINSGELDVSQQFEINYLQDGKPQVFAFRFNSRRGSDGDRGEWAVESLAPAKTNAP